MTANNPRSAPRQSSSPRSHGPHSLSPNEAVDPDELVITFPDDAHWDVFIADDDDRDPIPDHGDFYIEAPEALLALNH